MGNALEVKVRGSGWTPADQLSEGTLLIIGLHTILSRDSRPKLLLLDDLDRGLHPLAQEALIKQLMELATPTTKIVCTSHSPFILDPLPTESIQVVQQDKNGRTHLKGLSEHPDWERWKGQMTAGEFWLYAGDSWVTE